MNYLMRYLMAAGLGCMLQVSAGDAPAGGAGGASRGRFGRQEECRFFSPPKEETRLQCAAKRAAGVQWEEITRESSRNLWGAYHEEVRAEERAGQERAQVRDWCWTVPLDILRDCDEEMRKRIDDFSVGAVASISFVMDDAIRARLEELVRRGCALTLLTVENMEKYLSAPMRDTIIRSRYSCSFKNNRGLPVLVIMRKVFCDSASFYCGQGHESNQEGGFVRTCMRDFESLTVYPVAATDATFASDAAPRPTDEDDAAPAGEAAPRPVDRDSMDDDVLYS